MAGKIVAPTSLLYPWVPNGWFSCPRIPYSNLHPFDQVFLQLRMCFAGCIESRTPPSSTTTYTEEVRQSVVDTLWRITPVDTLRPHIPVNIWLRSNAETSLPLGWPRERARLQRAVRQVRELGDIELFKSYLFLVWLGQDWFTLPAFTKICTSIRENFGGIAMVHHRKDLIIRLDDILGQLDRRLGRLDQRFEPFAQRFWRVDQMSGHPYFAPRRAARIQYMELK